MSKSSKLELMDGIHMQLVRSCGACHVLVESFRLVMLTITASLHADAVEANDRKERRESVWDSLKGVSAQLRDLNRHLNNLFDQEYRMKSCLIDEKKSINPFIVALARFYSNCIVSFIPLLSLLEFSTFDIHAAVECLSHSDNNLDQSNDLLTLMISCTSALQMCILESHISSMQSWPTNLSAVIAQCTASIPELDKEYTLISTQLSKWIFVEPTSRCILM